MAEWSRTETLNLSRMSLTQLVDAICSQPNPSTDDAAAPREIVGIHEICTGPSVLYAGAPKEDTE